MAPYHVAWAGLALLALGVRAFVPAAPTTCRLARSSLTACRAENKGFGEKPKKPTPPPKTKAQEEREKYASAYDQLTQKGVPEYAVYIREKDSDQDKDWKYVGAIAVPRPEKPDSAIYGNEQNLVKAAYKMYPRLKDKEVGGWTYGYNLKKFPDEPIKIASAPNKSNNPFVSWIESMMNPLNASGAQQGPKA